MAKRKEGELSKHYDEQPFANELIEKNGGTRIVANLFKVNMSAISWWRKNGIPAMKLVKFAKFDASVKETEEYKKAIIKIEDLYL